MIETARYINFKNEKVIRLTEFILGPTIVKIFIFLSWIFTKNTKSVTTASVTLFYFIKKNIMCTFVYVFRDDIKKQWDR